MGKYFLSVLLLISLIISFSLPATKANEPSRKDDIYIVKSNGQSYKYIFGKIQYNPDLNLIHMTKTPFGLVWNPIPKMYPALDGTFTLSRYPLEPFSLYISPLSVHVLSINHARKIISLPLKHTGINGELYVYLGQLFSAKNWVIYSDDLRSPGTPQPFISELNIVNLFKPKIIRVTYYHSTGGDSFSIAISNHFLYYERLIPNAYGSYKKVAYAYNFDLMKTIKLRIMPNDLNWIAM